MTQTDTLQNEMLFSTSVYGNSIDESMDRNMITGSSVGCPTLGMDDDSYSMVTLENN